MSISSARTKVFQVLPCAALLFGSTFLLAQPDRVTQIRLMGCSLGAKQYAAEAHKIGKMLTLASSMPEEERKQTLKLIAEYGDQLQDKQYEEHAGAKYRDFDVVDTLLLHQAHRRALLIALQRAYKAPADPEIRHRRNIESECGQALLK
jgi:hypothetical protein